MGDVVGVVIGVGIGVGGGVGGLLWLLSLGVLLQLLLLLWFLLLSLFFNPLGLPPDSPVSLPRQTGALRGFCSYALWYEHKRAKSRREKASNTHKEIDRHSTGGKGVKGTTTFLPNSKEDSN